MVGFLSEESYTTLRVLTYCISVWQGLLLVYHMHPVHKGQKKKLPVSVRNIFCSASVMQFLSEEPGCCPALCPILLCCFSWDWHTHLSKDAPFLFFFPFTCLLFCSLPSLVIIPGYHCHFLEPLLRTTPQKISIRSSLKSLLLAEYKA